VRVADAETAHATHRRGHTSRRARRHARYREIAEILWQEHVLGLLSGTGLEAHAPSEAAQEARRGPDEARTRPVRIRRALERLGPAFIKLGQILSTRRDLVPPELADELAKLQDDVPTLPWPEMRERLEAELGAPLEDLYATFDEVPVASASIGQVYRATLRDGTPVAVKVQRPGVTEEMELDLEIMVENAHRVQAHTQWGKDYNVAGLADEFAAVLRSELDYTHEGRALDRFRTAFADEPQVVFPAVHWDHTTSRVLTMDFVDGVSGSRLERGEAPEIDRARVVQAGIAAYFRQIFELGYYHADPHAGNLFAVEGGAIAFVDFGRVATVTERDRGAALDLLLAILDDDPAAATEALLTMTGVPAHVDVATLEIEFGEVIAVYRRAERQGGGLDDLVRRLLSLLRGHRLRLPTELTVLLTTLGMVDGVAKQIDPEFRLVESARPFASKVFPAQTDPQSLLKRGLTTGRAWVRLADALPLHLTRLLRRAADGEFRVAVRPTEFASFVDRIDAGITRLAYALIVAALLLASSWLVSRAGMSRPEQVIYRVIFFAAFASVVWFLISLIRSAHRRRLDQRRGLD
jgi:ubiquinone biosynthesis protein